MLPVVLGTTISGEAITLVRCYQSNTTGGSGSFTTARYGAQFAIIGKHFRSKGNIKLESLRVEYQHLREWSGRRGLSFPTASRTEYEIKYLKPDDVQCTCKVLNNMLFTLSFSTNVQHRSGEVALQEHAWLTFTPQKPLRLEEFDTALFGFQNLLALAVSHPVHPVSVSAKVANGTYFVDFGDERIEQDTWVSIYFSAIRGQQEKGPLHELDMMFSLGMVESSLETLINTWFEKMAYLKPVCDLFIAVQRETKLYPEARFLFMAQAVETYHRRAMNNHEVSLEDHRIRLEQILSATPEAHRTWLEQKLQYSYEPSLRHRLKSLLNLHQSAIQHFISNPKVFMERVLNTRNYLTHYDANNAKKAATDAGELYDLAQDLKLILEICLLSELGFSALDLENITKKRLQFGTHRLIPMEE